MKQSLVCMALGLAAPWLSAQAVRAVEDQPAGAANVIVVEGVGEGVIEHVGSDGQQAVVVRVEAEAPGAAGGQKVVRVQRIGDAEDANRGWLGVSVGKVPETLSAQLNLNGQGVVILNVVEGSPADEAGLTDHDVILSINGEQAADLADFVDIVKSYQPGDAVDIRVVRDGQEFVHHAVLGARSEMAGGQWKFDVKLRELGEIEEQVRTHGRFLKRGPDGEWIMKDLGELNQLPEDLRMLIPESGTRSTQVFASESGKVVRTSIMQDGTKLEIEQENEGPITVRRTDTTGAETSTTYQTAEELQTADPEAYEAYSKAGNAVFLRLDTEGLSDGGTAFFHHIGPGQIETEFDFHADPEQFGNFDWHALLGENLEEVHVRLDEAMGEVRDALDQIRDQGLLTEESMAALERFINRGGPHMMFLRHPGPVSGVVQQSFEVRPDGTIELRTRKGDSELVQVFTSEADLQTRNPEAYEKYLNLADVGVVPSP